MSALPAPMPSGPPGPPEAVVQPGVLEGLFVHGLQPSGAFAAELCTAGYDARRPARDYPKRVLRACLEVACRHTHPGLPEAQAMRLLGECFWEGFLRTPLGRLVRATVPVRGPEELLKRLPRAFSVGSSSCRVAVHQEGPRAWRVELWDRDPLPDFDAGLIARALARTGITPTVEVAERAGDRFALKVRW